MPLDNAIDFLWRATQTHVILDSWRLEQGGFSPSQEVTIQADRLSKALEAIRSSGEGKVAYVFYRPESLLIVTGDALDAHDQAYRLAERLHDAAERARAVGVLDAPLGVPLQFANVPLSDVIGFMEALTKIPIRLDPSLRLEDHVSTMLLHADVQAGVVFQLLLELAHPADGAGVKPLIWVPAGREIVILEASTIKAPLNLEQTPLEVAIELLARATTTLVRWDEQSLEAAGLAPGEVRGRPITLQLSAGARIDDALRLMVRQAHPELIAQMMADGSFVIRARQRPAGDMPD